MSSESREHRRATLAVAILALLVSVFALAQPLVVNWVSHGSTIDRYLEALSSSSSIEVEAASAFAEQDSSAYYFSTSVSYVWLAHEQSRGSVAVEQGSVEKTLDSWKVCLPALATLDAKCRVYADFDFGTNGRITRFTVGGVPVEKLYRFPDESRELTGEDDKAVFQATYATKLRDPDNMATTLVFWLRQQGPADGQSPSPITFHEERLLVQDRAEQQVNIKAQEIPSSLPFYGITYASIRVPVSAQFVWMCWQGNLRGKDPCDWLYMP